jgi:ring-1,2-phenylacetyl-CoA epoxidase subunit PaaC
MENAISKCWKDFGGVVTFGEYSAEMSAAGLIDEEEKMKSVWLERVHALFENVHMKVDEPVRMENGNGRNGEHTEDLDQAIRILSEVYAGDKEAVSW